MYNISQPTYNEDVRSRISDDPENQIHNHRIDDSSQIGTRQPSSSEMRTEPTTSRRLGQPSSSKMRTESTTSRGLGQESSKMRTEPTTSRGLEQESSSEMQTEPTTSQKLVKENNSKMQTEPTISQKFGQKSNCSSQMRTRQPKTRFSQPKSSETQTMQTRSGSKTKKNKGKTVEMPSDNENESSSSETQTELTISRKFGQESNYSNQMGTQQPKTRFGQQRSSEMRTMQTRSGCQTKKNKGKAVERRSDNENETIELDNY